MVTVPARVGQRLDPQETLAKVRASMRQTCGNTSSMLQDVRAGRRTEIDWINGAIVRLADRHGIDIPVNRQLVELVRFQLTCERGKVALGEGDSGKQQRNGEQPRT